MPSKARQGVHIVPDKARQGGNVVPGKARQGGKRRASIKGMVGLPNDSAISRNTPPACAGTPLEKRGIY